MTKFEEIHEIPQFWSWAILIVFCACIIGWGFFNYFLIPEAPRDWRLGALEDVPGQSVYSTSDAAPAGEAPPQIAPLPVAPPQEPLTTSEVQASGAVQAQSQPASQSQPGGRP